LGAAPSAIAAYFAADTADAQAVADCFADDAVVIDEHREHRGLVAIRRWRLEAGVKYHYSSMPIAVSNFGIETMVTARVSGDFPGSPVELRYRFALDGDRIVSLEITP
jgi:hypothetical protein